MSANVEKKGVLVVDDDETINRLICDTLESYFCCETTSITNGDEALRLLQEEKFDLIITDIVHPGLRGIELYQEVKKNPKTCFIPLVFVSGTISKKMIELWGLGADCLRKPFKLDNFVKTVSKYLDPL